RRAGRSRALGAERDDRDRRLQPQRGDAGRVSGRAAGEGSLRKRAERRDWRKGASGPGTKEGPHGLKAVKEAKSDDPGPPPRATSVHARSVRRRAGGVRRKCPDRSLRAGEVRLLPLVLR